MPARPWANNAQLDFLRDCRAVFKAHQNSKSVAKFWSEIYRDFFEKWPDRDSERENLSKKERQSLPSTADLTEQQWIASRKRSIANWFNNSSKKKNKGIKITIPRANSCLTTEDHLYSKRYYDMCVKSLVEAEIGDQKLHRNKRIAIVNKHLMECFKKESTEVKEEIKRAREEEQTAKETAQGLDAAVVQAVNELSIDEMLIAQTAMPDVLADFCDEVGKCTGWSFVLLGGGPDAGNNGEITTISVHTGQDKYGQTFRQAYKNYKEAVEIPFSNHLKSVYSQSICNKFKAIAGPSSSTPVASVTPAPVPVASAAPAPVPVASVAPAPVPVASASPALAVTSRVGNIDTVEKVKFTASETEGTGQENIATHIVNGTKQGGLASATGAGNSVLQSLFTGNQNTTHQPYTYGFDYTSGVPDNNILSLANLQDVDWDAFDQFLAQQEDNGLSLWPSWNLTPNTSVSSNEQRSNIPETIPFDSASVTTSSQSQESFALSTATALVKDTTEEHVDPESLARSNQPHVQTTASTETLPVLGPRTQKPPKSKEVIPLVEKEGKEPE